MPGPLGSSVGIVYLTRIYKDVRTMENLAKMCFLH
jgi:hypothetical protein